MEKKNSPRSGPSLIQTIDKFRKGIVSGVFIDDTGFPGILNPPSLIDPNAMAWVAVLIPASKASKVMRDLDALLIKIKKSTGANEFHAVDIYNKTKEFTNVSYNIRYDFLLCMAGIIRQYDLPIIHQYMSPQGINDFFSRVDIPENIAGLDMRDPKTVGLLWIMFRVQNYLEKHKAIFNRKAVIFIDEGWKKANMALFAKWMNLELFEHEWWIFAKSHLIIPLQLADFAAFVSSRETWIGSKIKKNNVDLDILILLRLILPCRVGHIGTLISWKRVHNVTPEIYNIITKPWSSLRKKEKYMFLKWRVFAVWDAFLSMCRTFWIAMCYFCDALYQSVTGKTCFRSIEAETEMMNLLNASTEDLLFEHIVKTSVHSKVSGCVIKDHNGEQIATIIAGKLYITLEREMTESNREIVKRIKTVLDKIGGLLETLEK